MRCMRFTTTRSAGNADRCAARRSRSDVALAEAGLRRALAFVAQTWRDDAERLVPTNLYTVTNRGYIPRQQDLGTPLYRDADGRILACALAAA